MVIGGLEEELFEQRGKNRMEPPRADVLHLLIHLCQQRLECGCDLFTKRLVINFWAQVLRQLYCCIAGWTPWT